MQFVSTRNAEKKISFSQAILNCMSDDGGLYVPAHEENLRPWIMHMDENTPFTSIAGALTSALLQEEFSPIVSEYIATRAFPFSPVLKQLDDRLFVLELFHGATGCHKDFGVSYLASCMEHILLLADKNALIVTSTNGETGACITAALRGKKQVKALLLYSKGTLRGFSPEDCLQNGGNILPIEIDGTEQDCARVVRELFADKELVQKHSLTLANTVNIGRLLPQAFFYTFAFTRIKRLVPGDIFYALAAGNYGNLTAGLYSWKFSLPVTGFITDCTPSLTVDAFGKCCVLDSIVQLRSRGAADPATPSNIERLEEIFCANPAVLKGLVFPADISPQEQMTAMQDFFKKYGQFIDPQTAKAYAAARKRKKLVEDDDGSVVLISRDHPALQSETIRHWCGEAPVLPKELERLYAKETPAKTLPAEKTAVAQLLSLFETA